MGGVSMLLSQGTEAPDGAELVSGAIGRLWMLEGWATALTAIRIAVLSNWRWQPSMQAAAKLITKRARGSAGGGEHDCEGLPDGVGEEELRL